MLKVFHVVTSCDTVLQDVTRCYTCLHVVTSCCMMLEGVTRCYTLLLSVTRCYGVLYGVTCCYRVRMLQGVRRPRYTNLRVLPGATKCHTMLKRGTLCCTVTYRCWTITRCYTVLHGVSRVVTFGISRLWGSLLLAARDFRSSGRYFRGAKTLFKVGKFSVDATGLF